MLGPTISCNFYLNLDLLGLSHGNLYKYTSLNFAKKIAGDVFTFKCLLILHLWRVHTLGCLPPFHVPNKHFYSSPPPAWLFGPHHSPSCCENMGKANEKEVGLKRSLYRQSKMLHCSSYSALWLVVYAVNTQEKTMVHWLLAVPAWWSLKKKKAFSAPTVHWPTGKMPGRPDYQSSPGYDRPPSRPAPKRH